MANPSAKRQQNDVAKGFEAALNSHGYGFHYSVLAKVKELLNSNNSVWDFGSAEVPVEVQTSGTKIDFVLERVRTNNDADQAKYYLIAECKRANPALSNWCFIQAPYVRPNYRNGVLLWEEAYRQPSDMYDLSYITQPVRPALYTASIGHPKPAYHIGLEVKSNAQGDPAGQGQVRRAIEEAATQVLRGLNGTVEFFNDHEYLIPAGHRAILIPAIFTTAKLWVSDAQLQSADLATGNIDLSQAGFGEVDWLLYEYNMFPGLKHQQRAKEYERPSRTIGHVVEREFARTIAIVNASGIEDYLEWAGNIE